MNFWQNVQSSISNLFKINPEDNPRLDTANDLKSDEIKVESIIDEFFSDPSEKELALGSEFHHNKLLNNLEIGSIPTNKAVRLYNYKMMANFPEIKGAMEEIVDGMLNTDTTGTTVYGSLVEHELSKLEVRQLEKAIDEYLELFDFESNLFEYATKFLEEGELAWENLFDKDNKDVGFTGIRFLEPLCYEYGKDLQTGENIGLVIFSNNIDSNLQNVSNQYYNRLAPQTQEMMNSEKKCLFMPFEFLTYIDSGIYSPKKSFPYPILERARRAYNQLMLIEDSIIIYRLVRAPKRLVFNVDVGKMPKHRAEQELRKIVDKFNSKKVYNSSTGALENGYDAHTMLENMFFAKPTDGSGTSVESVGGETNLGEIEDLQYFLRKLYLSLKVPFTRHLEPTGEYNRVSSINYDEFKFSKFVIRLLNRLEKGLKSGVINHLKMKGLWESCELEPRNIRIQFNPPTVYELYIEQQINEARMDIYEKFRTGAIDNMSSYAMKKFLELDDSEIEEIWKSKESDAIRNAIIAHNASLAEQTGSAVKEDEDEVELTDDDFSGPSDFGGGGGPSDFGGGGGPSDFGGGGGPSDFGTPGGESDSDINLGGGGEIPEPLG